MFAGRSPGTSFSRLVAKSIVLCITRGLAPTVQVEEELVMLGIPRIDREKSNDVLRCFARQSSNDHRSSTNTSLHETVILPLPRARDCPQLYRPPWQVVQLVAAGKPGVGGTGFSERGSLETR